MLKQDLTAGRKVWDVGAAVRETLTDAVKFWWVPAAPDDLVSPVTPRPVSGGGGGEGRAWLQRGEGDGGWRESRGSVRTKVSTGE